MKKSTILAFLSLGVLSALLLSACGAAVAAAQGGPSTGVPKVLAVQVSITGAVDSMNGDQWVVGGQPVTVDPNVVSGRSIKVGDTVTVKGTVAPDGSVMASQVKRSGAEDAAEPSATPPAGSPTAEMTPGAATGTPAAGEDSDDRAGNETEGQSDDGHEISGIVQAVTGSSVTIDGKVYQLTNLGEVSGLLTAGAQVKIEYIVNSDGTLTIKEIKLSAGTSGKSGSDNNSGSDDHEGGSGSSGSSGGGGSDD